MKKVCFFTGTRAEYFLLRPVMQAVERHEELALQTLVSGAHLAPEYGSTIHLIERDNIRVDERVEMLLSSDSRVGMCKSAGLGLIGFGEALSRLLPDILVILGDRYEAFTAASAATFLNIPIVHIHGGERTEGAVDEVLRHAITKMSHLHLVAAEEYKTRVIQMGERPETVINCGALGLIPLAAMEYIPQKELEKELDFTFASPCALVTFHPVTREKDNGEKQMRALLSALSRLKEVHLLFTGVNADSGNRAIRSMIDMFAATHSGLVRVVGTLGQKRYFSALNYIDVVIGNSSSGIIEAPSFAVPVVNVGDRQRGRVMADTIITVEPEDAAIEKACRKAFSRSFKEYALHRENPFMQQDTLAIVIQAILQLDQTVTRKSFHDLS